MPMKDMKLAKQDPDEGKSMPATLGAREAFPYGLRINLDEEQIAKLPELEGVQAGDLVEIHALAKVTRVERTDRQNEAGQPKKERSMALQIQKLEVSEAAEQSAKDFESDDDDEDEEEGG